MLKRLTQDDLAFYEREGYLHLKGILPADYLDLIRGVLEGWVDRQACEWQERGLLENLREDLPFERRLIELWEAAGKPRYQRSPRRQIVGLDTFEFLTNPYFLDVAEDLLATEEVSMHGTFNVRPKLPDQKWTTTPWHQDGQYFGEGIRAPILTFWSPLQAVTEHNSCLLVAPGRHRDPMQEGYDDPESGFLGVRPEVAATYEAKAIHMEPGDVLIFDHLMPHCATSNHAETIRWSIDVRYEATQTASEQGKQFGLIARSSDSTQITTCAQWLEKWDEVPADAY